VEGRIFFAARRKGVSGGKPPQHDFTLGNIINQISVCSFFLTQVACYATPGAKHPKSQAILKVAKGIAFSSNLQRELIKVLSLSKA
jgi:hypothetical protein